MLANFLVDIVLIVIDPRIRAQAVRRMIATADTFDAPEQHDTIRGERPVARSLRRLLRKKIAVVCLTFIVLFYLVALFAPLIAPYGYAEQNLDKSFDGPRWEHPLGNDRNGRDVLSRVIYASRTTAIITLATVATGSIMLPLTLGMLSGYRGGWMDSLIMRVGEILSSLAGITDARADQRNAATAFR